MGGKEVKTYKELLLKFKKKKKNVLIIERKRISVRLADKKPEYLIAAMNNLIIAGNGSILISKSVSKSSIHKCTFQILLRILTFPKTGAFFCFMRVASS